MASAMTKKPESATVDKHPHLWRWLAEFGAVEIGPCGQTGSFIRVLDEGGLIWKGRRRYRSLDAALADAEAGVAKWMRDELGIEAATHT
jgi:hypothetical protein